MKYLLFLQSGHSLFRTADLGEVVCFGFPDTRSESELFEWEFSLVLFDTIMFDPSDINLTNCTCCQSRWHRLSSVSSLEEVKKKVNQKYTVIYTLTEEKETWSWVQTSLNPPRTLQTVEEVCALMYQQRQRRFFDEQLITEEELPHGIWSSYSKSVPFRLLPISPSRSRRSFVTS
jgi:hypothetical protein